MQVQAAQLLITIQQTAALGRVQAAMDSGVASRPIKDFDAYRDQLTRFVYQSGTPMEPVFAAAKRAPKRVVFAEGEDERVLRAAQVAVDEGLARPLLVGRAEVMTTRIQKLGLRLRLGDNCEGVNILDDPRYRDYGLAYYELMRRKGISRAQAMDEMRSRPTLVSAMMVRRGDADAMLCGTRGNYADHLKHVRDVIGLRGGVHTLAAMQMLILPGRQLFICDTHVNPDPDALALAEMTLPFSLTKAAAAARPLVLGAVLQHHAVDDVGCGAREPRSGRVRLGERALGSIAVGDGATP